MTKQLTPLRRKDQATGYQAAVREIVAYLQEATNDTVMLAVFRTAANEIEAKFEKRDGPVQ